MHYHSNYKGLDQGHIYRNRGHIYRNRVEEMVALALPVPNRSMLGAASGLGAAATSGAESNKSKTKNTQAFTQSEKSSL